MSQLERQAQANLEKKPEPAPGFYVTIAIATITGIVLNFLDDPIRGVFWAAAD